MRKSWPLSSEASTIIILWLFLFHLMQGCKGSHGPKACLYMSSFKKNTSLLNYGYDANLSTWYIICLKDVWKCIFNSWSMKMFSQLLRNCFGLAPSFGLNKILYSFLVWLLLAFLSTQSDNCPAFLPQVTKVMTRTLDIKWTSHSAWRPCLSGKVERSNETLKGN